MDETFSEGTETENMGGGLNIWIWVRVLIARQNGR
jgi:hypothetical protein